MLSRDDMLAGYRVEEIIGIGGMGIVYRGEQVALGRKVALKVLSPQLSRDATFRERFRREGAHAAALHHPNVVTVFDSGEVDGTLFIAMMLVEGSTLNEKLADGPMSLGETVALLRPIADALDAAHEFGIVHRDLKPQNILLDRRGVPFLADFGVAKAALAGADLTATRDFVGSLNYVAPEQIQGASVSPASDIYGLAVILFQCLTGTVPFSRDTEAGTIHAQLHDHPPLLPAVVPHGAELDRLLASGLAKDPTHRPASAGDLVRAAEAVSGLGDAADSRAALQRRATPGAGPAPERPFAAEEDKITEVVGKGPPPTDTTAALTHADRRRPLTAEPARPGAKRPRRGPLAAVAALLLLACVAAAIVVLDQSHPSHPRTHGAASTAKKQAVAIAAAHRVSLAISPVQTTGLASGSQITLRGTVAPVDATVTVGGSQATVAQGTFAGPARLHPGANSIVVTAKAAGYEPRTETLTVSAKSPTPKKAPSATLASVAPLEVAKPPDGTYSILVPSNWAYYAESSPEGTSTDLWIGPDPAEKLQVFVSNCASCAETAGSPSPRAVGFPSGTVSTVELNASAVGFQAFTTGDPNPDNGVIVVTMNGSRTTGYARAEVWLPSSQHSSATQILNGFSLLEASAG